jgi:hypothetical protein
MEEFESYKEGRFADLAVAFIESHEGNQSGDSTLITDAFDAFCQEKYEEWQQTAEEDYEADAADAARKEEILCR